MHRSKLPQITLHIGGKVVRQGLRRVQTSVMDAGHEAAQQCGGQARGIGSSPHPLHFSQREGQQANQGRATSQGLRHPGHQLELLTARQDEAARPPVLINHALQVRQQIRYALDLVKNRTVGVLG